MTSRAPQKDLFPWEEPDDEDARAGDPEPGSETGRVRTRALKKRSASKRGRGSDRSEPVEPVAERAEPARAAQMDEERADPLDAQLAAAAAILERLGAGETSVIERGKATRRKRPPVARKEYFAISEVCELVGLKPHVLRYWETQFPLLSPSKNRSGNRVYQRKEIKLVMLVKHLLYDEKYTIDGAKARMEKMRRGGELGPGREHALDAGTLKLLGAELAQLEKILRPPEPT